MSSWRKGDELSLNCLFATASKLSATGSPLWSTNEYLVWSCNCFMLDNKLTVFPESRRTLYSRQQNEQQPLAGSESNLFTHVLSTKAGVVVFVICAEIQVHKGFSQLCARELHERHQKLWKQFRWDPCVRVLLFRR